MTPSSHFFRTLVTAVGAAIFPWSALSAAEPIRVVFQNGRSVPLDAIALQGENIVIKTAVDGFNPGQSFPLTSADHIFGERPAGINPGIALLLSGDTDDALKLLEPIVASQQITSRIPGNHWAEAVRAAFVAYAVSGNAVKTAELGKAISDSTPAPGVDPYVSLGKALLMPNSATVDARESALLDLTTDNLPADLCAYAAFYRGMLLKGSKRNDGALEAFLTVPGLYPSGGVILTGAAELNAAELLAALGRREEAVALLTSAARSAAGTLLATEANKRLESLK